MFGYRRNNFITEINVDDENSKNNIDETKISEEIETENKDVENTDFENVDTENKDNNENVENIDTVEGIDTVEESSETVEAENDRVEKTEEIENEEVSEKTAEIEVAEESKTEENTENENSEERIGAEDSVDSINKESISTPKKKSSKIWNAFAFLIFTLCAGVMFYYANKSSELATENYEIYILVIKIMFIGISASWICGFIGALNSLMDKTPTGSETVKGIIHGIFVVIAMFPMSNLWLGAFVNIDYLISYLSSGMQTSMLFVTFLLAILEALIQLVTLFSNKQN